jgi:hypothetical protein
MLGQVAYVLRKMPVCNSAPAGRETRPCTLKMTYFNDKIRIIQSIEWYSVNYRNSEYYNPSESTGLIAAGKNVADTHANVCTVALYQT